MEIQPTSRPVPSPPKVKLTAALPVAAGILLVRQSPDGSVAWATSSTAMTKPATGSAENELVAHLAALEAFLDHPDHADRLLTIDVEDTAAGREVVQFAAKHLPRIPTAARADLRDHADRNYPGVWDALADQLGRPTEGVSPLLRVVGASSSGWVIGQDEAGWAWVTSDGRWKTGTLRNRNVIAVEVIALLRLVSAHRDAQSFHLECGSRPALAVIHQVRSEGLDIRSTMADLGLHPSDDQKLFERLVRHEADFTFEWVPDDPRHVLTYTATRLAVQARRALRSGMPHETFAKIQANIIDDLQTGTSVREKHQKTDT